MEEFTICPVKFSGQPENAGQRLTKEQMCYDLLDELEIQYDRVDHDAADTIAACHRVETVLGSEICKNLFLCNRQKTQYYLLLMQGDKVFKTKDLSKQLGCARLSFADSEDLMKCLNLTPGSVSVLGPQFDQEKQVQLVVDRPIQESRMIACHPCINTSTVAFPAVDLFEKVLPALKHTPIFVDLPQQAQPDAPVSSGEAG